MTTSTTNTTDSPLSGTGPTGVSSSGGQDSTSEQVKSTASVAQDEAKQVASDVREQARGLLNETRTQVEDQSRTQRDRLVDTMRTFSNDLDGMAEQRSGLASDAAREVANRVRSFGQQLDGREPTELLDDLRSFARRRPGVFLAGSVIAGVVVGRFLRGTRDASQTDSQTRSTGYPSGNQYAGPTGVAVTPENPLGTSYDTTTTAHAPIDPLTSPPASPAVTSGESERPVGGL
jgi:hypothetical protein